MTPYDSSVRSAIYDQVLAAKHSWSGVLHSGEILRLTDLEGQQAVDFLCYDADDPADRYSATNTIKIQGSAFVVKKTVLYSDSGRALLTVIEDSVGRHDTLYGCCSEANNILRYGAPGTGNCYANFLAELSAHGLNRSSIVANVNFFMHVPIFGDGSLGIAEDVSAPGSYVELRAECDVLIIISNCPQILNPCNGYKPTPIRLTVFNAIKSRSTQTDAS